MNTGVQTTAQATDSHRPHPWANDPTFSAAIATSKNNPTARAAEMVTSTYTDINRLRQQRAVIEAFRETDIKSKMADLHDRAKDRAASIAEMQRQIAEIIAAGEEDAAAVAERIASVERQTDSELAAVDAMLRAHDLVLRELGQAKV